jgi:hypothetical protein
MKGRKVNIRREIGFLPVKKKIRTCPYGLFRSNMINLEGVG